MKRWYEQAETQEDLDMVDTFECPVAHEASVIDDWVERLLGADLNKADSLKLLNYYLLYPEEIPEGYEELGALQDLEPAIRQALIKKFSENTEDMEDVSSFEVPSETMKVVVTGERERGYPTGDIIEVYREPESDLNPDSKLYRLVSPRPGIDFQYIHVEKVRPLNEDIDDIGDVSEFPPTFDEEIYTQVIKYLDNRFPNAFIPGNYKVKRDTSTMHLGDEEEHTLSLIIRFKEPINNKGINRFILQQDIHDRNKLRGIAQVFRGENFHSGKEIFTAKFDPQTRRVSFRTKEAVSDDDVGDDVGDVSTFNAPTVEPPLYVKLIRGSPTSWANDTRVGEVFEINRKGYREYPNHYRIAKKNRESDGTIIPKEDCIIVPPPLQENTEEDLGAMDEFEEPSDFMAIKVTQSRRGKNYKVGDIFFIEPTHRGRAYDEDTGLYAYETFRKVFPTGTTIPSHGFVVLDDAYEIDVPPEFKGNRMRTVFKRTTEATEEDDYDVSSYSAPSEFVWKLKDFVDNNCMNMFAKRALELIRKRFPEYTLLDIYNASNELSKTDHNFELLVGHIPVIMEEEGWKEEDIPHRDWLAEIEESIEIEDVGEVDDFNRFRDTPPRSKYPAIVKNVLSWIRDEPGWDTLEVYENSREEPTTNLMNSITGEIRQWSGTRGDLLFSALNELGLLSRSKDNEGNESGYYYYDIHPKA